MNNKILVVGNGYIGNRLAKHFNCPITGDWINNLQDALAIVKKYQPQTIINCIGFTGKNNVDDCELDLDGTIHANTFVPILLAEACLRSKVRLVHISSGCIYHYDYEKDPPIPEEQTPYYFDLYYSRSKIYSERALEVLAKQFELLILRIRIPLDTLPHPRNIIAKLTKFDKVIDVPNSITYIPDFIQALEHLLKVNARGLYNVTNKGALRYPELLKVYQKYVPDFKFEAMPLKNLKLSRTNLVLSVAKLEKSGFKMRRIQDVLDECVKEYLKNRN